jgi:hypothetical protein
MVKMAGNNNGFENAKNTQSDKVGDNLKDSSQPNSWNTVDLCQGADKNAFIQQTSGKTFDSQLPSLTLSGLDEKSASASKGMDIHDSSMKTADARADWSESSNKQDSVDYKSKDNSTDSLNKKDSADYKSKDNSTDSLDKKDLNSQTGKTDSVDYLEKTGWSTGGESKDRQMSGEGAHMDHKGPEMGQAQMKSDSGSTDSGSTTVQQVIDAGGSAEQVRAAGGSADQVISAGGDASQVRMAGGSEEQVKQVGGTTEQTTTTDTNGDWHNPGFAPTFPQSEKSDVSGLMAPRDPNNPEKLDPNYKHDPEVLY